MNDAADEPSEPTSAEPGFREISDEELRCILENHKRWLAAEDKTGLDHLRADLSRADLHHAQLQGADLRHANLYEAQLQGANLREAQLQQAYLRRAQLQGASLRRAHLRGADLTVVNFDRLAGAEDGEPGQQRPADLTNADFRDADLSNAQLSTVTGLRAEMLAGAVLTNAKLPEDIRKFDKLTHVAETSRNASTVFFGLLAASLYSWLTIATTTDVGLITGTASSPLPIINTNIALSGFYLAAPLILIAVYFYFHLYLQRLWRGLASLPAVFPDGEALDDKAYPWLLNGLVRAHFKKLELTQRPLTRVENIVSILLAWWVVPLTLLAFWLRFLPRHDWWVTTLHVALITGAAWFGVYSYRLAVQTLKGEETATPEEKRGDEPLRVRAWRTLRGQGMRAAAAFVAIILVFSIHAWNDPGGDMLTALGFGFGYETYADLTGDNISLKPSGWTGRDETAEVEIAQVMGADLVGRDLRAAAARGAFLAQAKLAQADLHGAVLWDADLSRADLSSANLSGANLGGANLSGAYLMGADLSGANLIFSRLRGANLSGAHLMGADLSFSSLSGANLSGAYLMGADLSGAYLMGANLGGADLRNAHGVTQAQLDLACGDDETRLPQGLTIRTCPDTAPPASPGSS